MAHGELSGDKLTAEFSTLDSCVVSDAMDALGLSGAVDGLHPLWEGASVVGRAMTMKLEPVEDGSPRSTVHLGARAIEAAAPGSVIVVDNGGRTAMGSWGGLLSLAASVQGVAGVVSDGACRDVDEARQLEFPLFARGGTPRTARARVREVSCGEPVSIGGIYVQVGDYIVADGSGVVVVPASEAARVLAKAMELKARESRMAELIQAGAAVVSVLNGEYESMLAPTRSSS